MVNDENVFAFTFSPEELRVLNRALNFWLATLRAAGRIDEPRAKKVEAVLRRVDESLGIAETIEKRKTDRELRKIGDLPHA